MVAGCSASERGVFGAQLARSTPRGAGSQAALASIRFVLCEAVVSVSLACTVTLFRYGYEAVCLVTTPGKVLATTSFGR